mmetsp:Transcript_26445/g.67591  ORF Transcript_26445/g.67591 Transcript_26445/m.67591 type:complete len:145 (-) Transcript_26445:122-556(-)
MMCLMGCEYMASHGIDGGKKDEAFMAATGLKSFKKAYEVTSLSVRDISKMMKVFGNESPTDKLSDITLEGQTGGRGSIFHQMSGMNEATEAFVEEAGSLKWMPPQSGVDTLENDGTCEISGIIVFMQTFDNKMRLILHELLKGY